MKKVHYVNNNPRTDAPFCMARVDMKVFNTTEDKDKVTCRLCLMTLGIIEDTRGNWDNRSR